MEKLSGKGSWTEPLLMGTVFLNALPALSEMLWPFNNSYSCGGDPNHEIIFTETSEL